MQEKFLKIHHSVHFIHFQSKPLQFFVQKNSIISTTGTQRSTTGNTFQRDCTKISHIYIERTPSKCSILLTSCIILQENMHLQEFFRIYAKRSKKPIQFGWALKYDYS